MAVKNDVSVQEINTSLLQDMLHKDGSATNYFSDILPGNIDFLAVWRWESGCVLLYYGACHKIGWVSYIDVAADPHRLRNGTSGEIIWLENTEKEWEDKKYYYPIPQSHMLLNPNLRQNTNWD